MTVPDVPTSKPSRNTLWMDQDVLSVVRTTLATSVIYFAVQLALSRFVTPFDSSHLVHSPPSPNLRWDAVHFMEIAKNGYQWEQHLAFQPGWQAILHFLDRIGGALYGAVVLNTLARVGANVFLFK